MSNTALIGGREIRMVLHEGCRRATVTMAEIDEVTPKEHFSEEIDIVNIGLLTALLAAKWVGARIIGITATRNQIILITAGIVRLILRYWQKTVTMVPQVS